MVASTFSLSAVKSCQSVRSKNSRGNRLKYGNKFYFSTNLHELKKKLEPVIAHLVINLTFKLHRKKSAYFFLPFNKIASDSKRVSKWATKKFIFSSGFWAECFTVIFFLQIYTIGINRPKETFLKKKNRKMLNCLLSCSCSLNLSSFWLKIKQ